MSTWSGKSIRLFLTNSTWIFFIGQILCEPTFVEYVSDGAQTSAREWKLYNEERNLNKGNAYLIAIKKHNLN